MSPLATPRTRLGLSAGALLAVLCTVACGPAEGDALDLGLTLAYSAQMAVPPGDVATLEVGGLAEPNTLCGTWKTGAIVTDPVCPPAIPSSQLTLLPVPESEGGGQSVKRRFNVDFAASAIQTLGLRIPVSEDMFLVVQARDRNQGFLGSGCVRVGRITVSGPQFTDQSLKLVLDSRYTTCQPVLP